MEKDGAEELQLLGAMGIVREAFNILLSSSHRKLLWALALTLLLPLSIASLGHRFFSGNDFPKISQKQIEETILRGETIGRVWREALVGVAAYKTREALVRVAAYKAFRLAMSVLSPAAVVYTVASIYTANTKNLKVSYVRVLRADVPRVWKRLSLTFLWFLIIFFVLSTAGILANILLLILFFPTILFPAVGGEADHKSNSGVSVLAFPFGLILVTVVGLSLRTYISTVCYLACVVSVLEDKYYGLAAMRRSNQLIKGKRTTALALIILHDILAGAIGEIFVGAVGELFVYAVVDWRSHGVGITTRAVYGVLLVGLLCFVNLMELLTQSVLYFVCNSYHHESRYNNSVLKVYKSAIMTL